MKKSLNNIFDEANSKDIENLVNKNPAPEVSADTLSSVKKKVYSKTGIPNTKNKKPFIFRWQSYATMAACLCLVIGGILFLPKILKISISVEPPSEDKSGTQVILNETNTSESTPAQSSNDTESTTTNNNSNNSNNNNDANNKGDYESLKNPDNGVLKKASVEKMSLPENMKLLESNEATEENKSADISASVVTYTLDGNIVNWATENDFIYVITEGNNRLVIIDSNAMTPVYNTPLAGVPAEMNIIGDKIYISLPDLYRIDVFSKLDCKKETSIYFEHEVSSFCLDGDFIYYSEHSQHCRVFKKDLATNELTMLRNNGGYTTFYYPKLYLNKEDRILYIGESQSTGSAIYYYDADTFELKSMFKKDNYGIMNHTREIFHVGDEIFWGNYRLSDTNAKELVGRYGTVDYGSVVFASEELVSTYEGLFLTDTYECVIDYFDDNFGLEYILVSDSYNVFFRKRSFDSNIIIGVNFELQEEFESI